MNRILFAILGFLLSAQVTHAAPVVVARAPVVVARPAPVVTAKPVVVSRPTPVTPKTPIVTDPIQNPGMFAAMWMWMSRDKKEKEE